MKMKSSEMMAGLLTHVLFYFEPSRIPKNEYSGFLISVTFTVAGAVLAFHQIPF